MSQTLELMSPPGTLTRKGDRRQRDSTLDLIWISEAATLDDTFQDIKVDFSASLGSDHAGIWASHYPTTATTDATNPNKGWPPYTIQDSACETWVDNFRRELHLPPLLTDRETIEREADRLSQRIEEVSVTTFEPRHVKPIRCT